MGLKLTIVKCLSGIHRRRQLVTAKPGLTPLRETPGHAWGPPWIGPVHRRLQIDLLWLLVAVLMTTAGLLFFGWRGLLGVCRTALWTLVTYALVAAVMGRVRPTRRVDSNLHALVLGLLLGLVMPVVLDPFLTRLSGWLLGVTAHFVGRSHRIRAHPVAVVWLVVWALCHSLYGPAATNPFQFHQSVLRPQRIVVGDVCDVTDGQPERQSWFEADPRTPADAQLRLDPYALLVGQQKDLLESRSVLAGLVSSRQICPMSDLILGAVPGGVGSTSKGLLIAVGLYLVYRRVSSWPMAVTGLGAAVATLLLAPLFHGGRPTLVLWRLIEMGPATAITFTAYFILASPLAVILMILGPQTAPVSAKGRVVYGALLGSGLMLAQWFLATTMSGCFSLLVASTLSRPLDALHKSRFASPSTAQDGAVPVSGHANSCHGPQA